MTAPPPPPYPPSADATDPTPGQQWWRGGSVAPIAPPMPLYAPAPSVEQVASAFWAPAGKLFAEQATAIASQVGDQIGQLLTETEAQRAARQQVEYESLISSQRAQRDAAFKAAGETPVQRAERHRIEDVLTPATSHREDLVGMVDLLADRIGESPEERTARKRAEAELAKARSRAHEDARLAAAGETPEQRTRRHRQQQLADQHEARVRARRQRRRAAREAGPSDRTKRFRLWCLFTAISATGGYAVHLVQVLTPGGPLVGLLAAGSGLVLDLYTRDGGRLRVSEARGWALALMLALRVPVASGLAVATGIAPLLAFLTHLPQH
ncbi:hypothetical protein [Kitasatospora cineracea]|uniref:Uncharacterized protein n=1 Tax=Kitasatospora cineracea TaxID=88074 RepID=A0A3N4RV51_9ACTN|nr:hypothetical protein [Kitasatospora cineracea]RPE34939.1 hypothetical protein EDD38_3282 [Kitasatospora cineracea]